MTYNGLRSRFKSVLRYSLAVWPQASYLISLSLSFPKDKMGISPELWWSTYTMSENMEHAKLPGEDCSSSPGGYPALSCQHIAGQFLAKSKAHPWLAKQKKMYSFSAFLDIPNLEIDFIDLSLILTLIILWYHYQDPRLFASILSGLQLLILPSSFQELLRLSTIDFCVLILYPTTLLY